MRKAMVTRTFKTLSVLATVLDTQKNTVEQKTLTLSRVVPEKKILAKLQDAYNTETTKVVHVISFEEVEQLRGMTEQKFLENSVALDPKRHAVEEAEAEDDSDDTEDDSDKQ